jgi:hypothetical protein
MKAGMLVVALGWLICAGFSAPVLAADSESADGPTSPPIYRAFAALGRAAEVIDTSESLVQYAEYAEAAIGPRALQTASKTPLGNLIKYGGPIALVLALDPATAPIAVELVQLGEGISGLTEAAEPVTAAVTAANRFGEAVERVEKRLDQGEQLQAAVTMELVTTGLTIAGAKDAIKVLDDVRKFAIGMNIPMPARLDEPAFNMEEWMQAQLLKAWGEQNIDGPMFAADFFGARKSNATGQQLQTDLEIMKLNGAVNGAMPQMPLPHASTPAPACGAACGQLKTINRQGWKGN